MLTEIIAVQRSKINELTKKDDANQFIIKDLRINNITLEKKAAEEKNRGAEYKGKAIEHKEKAIEYKGKAEMYKEKTAEYSQLYCTTNDNLIISKEENASKEVTIREQSHDNLLLSNDLQAAKKAVKDLENANLLLCDELEKAKRALKDQTDAYLLPGDEFKESKTAVDELEVARKDVKNLEGANSLLRDELNVAKADIKKLEGVIVNLESDVANQCNHSSLLNSKLEETYTTVISLQSELQKELDNLETTKILMDGFLINISKLKKNAEEDTKGLTAIADKLTTAEETINRHESTIEELVNDHSILNDKLLVAKGIVTSLRSVNKGLEEIQTAAFPPSSSSSAASIIGISNIQSHKKSPFNAQSRESPLTKVSNAFQQSSTNNFLSSIIGIPNVQSQQSSSSNLQRRKSPLNVSNASQQLTTPIISISNQQNDKSSSSNAQSPESFIPNEHALESPSMNSKSASSSSSFGNKSIGELNESFADYFNGADDTEVDPYCTDSDAERMSDTSDNSSSSSSIRTTITANNTEPSNERPRKSCSPCVIDLPTQKRSSRLKSLPNVEYVEKEERILDDKSDEDVNSGQQHGSIGKGKRNEDDSPSISTANPGINTSSRITNNKKRGRGEMSEPVDDDTDDDVNDDNTRRQSSFTYASSSSSLPYAPSSSNQPKTAVKRKQNKNRFVCEHGKRKELCREGCGGSAYCAPHGREKSRCKECKGSGICPCGKVKSQCKKCGGSIYCIPHGNRKAYCKDCGGSAICEHENRTARCLICKDKTVIQSEIDKKSNK